MDSRNFLPNCNIILYYLYWLYTHKLSKKNLKVIKNFIEKADPEMESVHFKVQIKYHSSGQIERFSNEKDLIPNFMDVAKFIL